QLRRLTLTRHVRDGQRQQQEQRSRRDLAVGYDWWQHHVLGREREDVVLPGVDPVQAPPQERATDLDPPSLAAEETVQQLDVGQQLGRHEDGDAPGPVLQPQLEDASAPLHAQGTFGTHEPPRPAILQLARAYLDGLGELAGPEDVEFSDVDLRLSLEVPEPTRDANALAALQPPESRRVERVEDHARSPLEQSEAPESTERDGGQRDGSFDRHRLVQALGQPVTIGVLDRLGDRIRIRRDTRLSGAA